MEPIAIIGIGCRFPKADSPEHFWRLLLDGGDAITEIPSSRWNLEEFYDERADAPGKMNSRWGGFLENLDRFDAGFFRISPREARLMDPQQRLLLEVAWEALEDAGQAAAQLAQSRVGVFIGVMNTEFGHRYLQQHQLVNTLLGAGSSAGIAANRLSYFFNFHGPSLVVDTLCSSSLVAVHMACQSLWNGESAPLAIAGGVNVILRPTMNIFYAKSGLTAPDGRCKTFDVRANGIVRGEGAGVVILKPLRLALADGDPIYCLIRGSAVNHDGRTNGLTAPNRWAQMALLEAAYQRAGVSPAQVQYVEAHGTGTPLGDPIEMKALGAVLAQHRPTGGATAGTMEERCAVGSVKTNIGHLESAAGIASLIKTALMLKHRTRVRSLHFENPNPYIPFDELPLRVQQQVERWTPDGGTLVAGVSSFGLGGTNAHTVLESFQAATEPLAETQSQIEKHQVEEHQVETPLLLPLSARSPEALRASAEALRQLVGIEASGDSAPNLYDLCYTASARRSHHDFRLALLARSLLEVQHRLDSFLAAKFEPELFRSPGSAADRPQLVFVFAGQGSQWAGMGLELFEKEPVFRGVIEQCDALLSQQASWSLIDELRADGEQTRLAETEIAQPAIFAVQAGLAALWASWGIRPEAVIGHSVGEVAAAHLAGVFTLEEALTIICQRGRVMQRAHRQGKMLAVKLADDRLEEMLADYGGRISLAALNAPNSFTLSGEPQVMAKLLEALPGYGAVGRMLQGEYAFHSPQMEPLQQELTAALRDIQPRAASLQLLSTLTGEPSDGLEYVPAYWAKQIREPVRFAPALGRLLAAGFCCFVEISPEPVLVGAVTQTLRHEKRQGVALASLKRQASARVTLASALGALYAQGFEVDWRAHYRQPGRCVALPAYPWQKERLWLEDEAGEAGAQSGGVERRTVGVGHPLLGLALKSAIHPGACFWQGELSAETCGWLAEHRLDGESVLPAAAVLEMAICAAGEVYATAQPVLENVQFQKALMLKPTERRAIQLALTAESSGQARFQFFSSPLAATTQTPADEWTLHAQGMIRLQEPQEDSLPPAPLPVERGRERCQQVLDVAQFYESLRRGGLDYGDSFQRLVELRRGEDGAIEALARLRISETIRAEATGYRIHPALLDACFHPLLAAQSPELTDVYFPMSVDCLRWFASSPMDFADGYAHARLANAPAPGAEVATGDITVFDRSGKPLLEVRGLQGRRLHTACAPPTKAEIGNWLYQLRWQPQAKPTPVVSVDDVSAQMAVQADALLETASGSASTWLLFSDRSGIGEVLRERLQRQGESVITVFAGDAYGVLGNEQYQVKAAEATDFRRLLDACAAANLPPCRQVVHLWSCDAVTTKQATPATLQEAQTLGCISALHLLHALDQTAWKVAPRLWLVTRQAQAVEDAQAVEASAANVEVAQSPLWGLGKTIAQELPQLRCTMVDLGGDSPSRDGETLFQEMAAPDDASQIAWRGRKRYTATLSRCPITSGNGLPEPTADQRPSRLRADGSYLITGGLGALGLQVARWMVENGARHLVLLGRNAPSVGAQQALAQMAQSGAHIQLAHADIADAGQVVEAFARMRREMPPLRGVIHAAGVLRDAALLRTDAESFRRVMAPKLSGAWNLHSQTLDLSLDFFVMFSSLASLTGSKGQGNYAAANAFLDALAHHRNHMGQPAMSINWGPWGEIGMAAALGERMALAGLDSLTPEQGVEVLGRLLGEPLAQVAVIPGSNLFSAEPPGFVANAFAGNAPALAPSDFLRQFAEAPFEQRQQLLVAHIQAAAAEVLGYLDPQAIEGHRNLFDMGMDSLMAVELGSRLQQSLEQNFSLSLVFEHPSVEKLVAALNVAASSLDSRPAYQDEAG